MKLEFYKTETILSLISSAINDGVAVFVLPNGKKVRVTRKMKTFHFHGTKCSKCGLEGMFFMESAEEDVADLNLFGLTGSGKYNEKEMRPVMLTVDHIIPLSKNGGNHQENLQVMCKECNGEKGNRLEKKIEFGFLFRSVRDYVLSRYPKSKKRERFLAEFKELVRPYRIPKTNSVLCGSKYEIKQYLEYVRGKYGYKVPFRKIKTVCKPEKQNYYNDGTNGHEIVVFLPTCAEGEKHDSDFAHVAYEHAALSDGNVSGSC